MYLYIKIFPKVGLIPSNLRETAKGAAEAPSTFLPEPSFHSPPLLLKRSAEKVDLLCKSLLIGGSLRLTCHWV